MDIVDSKLYIGVLAFTWGTILGPISPLFGLLGALAIVFLLGLAFGQDGAPAGDTWRASWKRFVADYGA